MVDVKDVRTMKLVRAEFCRRGLDISRADLHIQHGILTVQGIIPPFKGQGPEEMKHEVDLVLRHLRSKPEIRDVIVDVAYLA